jgi:Subtilase family
MRRRWNAGKAAVVLAAVLVVGWPAPAGADRIRDQQWHVGYLDLARAHELSQGEGITIAVIDSGVDGTHPDLEGNVLPGLDTDAVVDGGEPGDGWNDPDGHGTGMAGLIAAHGHGPGNSEGALGVAPKAKIIPFRIPSEGLPDATYGDKMALAIDEAISRDVDIISMSLRGVDPLQIKPALEAGILVVVGAGNNPTDTFLNAPPDSLSVGAVRSDGMIADVSTRGIFPPPPLDELWSETSARFGFVCITAPGEEIASTSIDHGYRAGTGTSDSTAIVSGAAALLWSLRPELTADQVMRHLIETSIDKGTPGPDLEYGYGDLDIVRALETEPTPTTTTSLPSITAPRIPRPRPGSGDETAATTAGNGSGLAASGIVVAVGAAVVAAAAFSLSFASRRRQPVAFAGGARSAAPVGAPPPPGPAVPGPIGAPPPPGAGGPRKSRSAGVLAGAGFLAVVVAIVGGVYAVSGDGGGGGDRSTTTTEFDRSALPEAGPAGSPAPTGLPEHDGLAQDCFDGTMVSCDALASLASDQITPDNPAAQTYATFGETCGDRRPPGTELCIRTFADS